MPSAIVFIAHAVRRCPRQRKEQMGALSNVKPVENSAVSSSVGCPSGALPKANAVQGVSVGYAPDPRKAWHVLRVLYGQGRKAFDELRLRGVEGLYFPTHKVVKERIVDGKTKRVKADEPYLPNIIFMYNTAQEVDRCVRGDNRVEHITYYYDHFTETQYGKNPPLTIPRQQMDNFIRLTSIDNEHIRVVTPRQCHFKSGDTVRIVAGGFSGITGRVARIAGQQRVVIELPNVCLVATAYIPSAFLERME